MNIRKFETPEVLEKLLNDYFDYCDAKDKPYTISGMAVFLDCDKQTLANYGKMPEYSGLIKKAKQKCEQNLEEGAMSGKYNSTFCIFSAKNNYKWTDKVEVEQNFAENQLVSALQKALNTQVDENEFTTD